MKRIPKTLSILKSNLKQTLELRLSNVKETKVPLLRAAVDLLHSDGSNRQLNTHLRLKVAAQSQKSRFRRNRENETTCRFQKQPMPLPKFLYTPTVLRDEQEKERKSSQEKQIKDALDFIDPETTDDMLKALEGRMVDFLATVKDNQVSRANVNHLTRMRRPEIKVNLLFSIWYSFDVVRLLPFHTCASPF